MKEIMKMKILSVFSRIAFFGLVMSVGGAVASAQGYYDDDIYYDASKVKKEPKAEKPKQSPQSTQYYYDGAQYVPWNNVGEYQSADTYQVSGTSSRDVDEYNRHSAVQPKETTDSITLQQFEALSNTRNLARFHDSEEAQAAYAENADTYAYDGGSDNYYYAATQPTTTVNLNIVGGYGYPYYSYYPYYGSPWYWNRWGYDPWWGYDPYWGPSWSWGWHGPGWGWCGPSWSWGWGGHHHGWHNPGWSPGRPHHATVGNTPNRGTGTYRGGTAGRYGSAGNRSSAAGSLGTRPSYGGTVNRGSSTGTSRPGYRAPTGTPNVNGSSGVVRGRTPNSSYGTSNGNSTQHRNSYNSNSNTNRGNSNYNSNSYNSSRGRSGSSGSFSSGGSRGGYSGGGSSRGSGGGHRGR